MDCRGGSRLLVFVLVGSGFLMAGGSQPSSNTGVNVGISSSSSGHLVLHQTQKHDVKHSEPDVCVFDGVQMMEKLLVFYLGMFQASPSDCHR